LKLTSHEKTILELISKHPDIVDSPSARKLIAKQYGLTIESYKTNNLLGVEVNSMDVSELAAEMCGSLFSKTTAAQIPIDGGNERVI